MNTPPPPHQQTEEPPFNPQANRPALWNPNAAANWSLLFTPAFGAFLHARNAQTLGRLNEAKTNWIWFGVTIAFVLVVVPIVNFAILITSSGKTDDGEGFTRLIGLLLLILWYFIAARKQIRFVKDTYGSNYERKSWAIPLLVGFGSCFLWFSALFAIGFITALIVGQTKL